MANFSNSECWSSEKPLEFGHMMGVWWLVRGITFTLMGAGLIINCVLGLMRRDGVYNAESANIMFWSQVLGIAVGAAAFLWGLKSVGMFRIVGL
jgi:hypothetical protein